MSQSAATKQQYRPEGRFWAALILGVIAWILSIAFVATASYFSGSFLGGLLLLAALAWGYLLAGIGLYLCYKGYRAPLAFRSARIARSWSRVRAFALFLNYTYLASPFVLLAYGAISGSGRGGYHGP